MTSTTLGQDYIPATHTARPRRPAIREITPVYWRRLIEVGVPLHIANVIAWAIARYDAVQKQPEPQERLLINRYCRQICRAELWRSQLLLEV